MRMHAGGGGGGSDASSEALGELALDAEHVDFMTAPDSFCCPITHEILRNPVVASDGCARAAARLALSPCPAAPAWASSPVL